MSLFFRKSEQRAVSSASWISGGDLSKTVTQERALALTPVFAANRHITDYCSTLPLQAFRKAGDERIPVTLPKLFADLRTDGKLVPWLGQATSSIVLRGNAVGLINATDGFGFPTLVTWVSMDRVYVDDSSGVGNWYIDGRPVSRLDLVHIPWITVPGRTLGLSPIEYYAATINAGLDSQSFGTDWFKNGGVPPSVFKNVKQTVTDEQSSKVRAKLVQSIRRREPLVTGSEWDFTPITIPPEQAQFIETQKLSANQIAAIYGIEPTEVGGEAANSQTYTTEELKQISRAANMHPYIFRLEEAFQSLLPNRQFVRLNIDAKIRADIKTRHEVYEIESRIGLRSLNELRTLEDLPPVPGGNVHVPPAPAQPAAGNPPAPNQENGSPDE